MGLMNGFRSALAPSLKIASPSQPIQKQMRTVVIILETALKRFIMTCQLVNEFTVSVSKNAPFLIA